MVFFLRDALGFRRRFGWFEFYERTVPAASRVAMRMNWEGGSGVFGA